MKLFDAVALLSADGGEFKIEDLVSKMDADALLVCKFE